MQRLVSIGEPISTVTTAAKMSSRCRAIAVLAERTQTTRDMVFAFRFWGSSQAKIARRNGQEPDEPRYGRIAQLEWGNSGAIPFGGQKISLVLSSDYSPRTERY